MSNNQQSGGGLTVTGRIFVIAIIIVFSYLGFMHMSKKHEPGSQQTQTDTLKIVDLNKQRLEAPDLKGITTTQEYRYVAQEKLPPVKESAISSYKKLDPNAKIVEFPINVWIGWLPIISANHGYKPNKDSLFYKKYGFMVNITLIDDPVAARNAFAAGKSHILWGTLDMMALFAPELMKDSRTSPRICQIVDWSNGGDGIVVRENIRTVQDLKGKTVVYAQNSPSQYYINNLLLSAGVQPADLTHKYTATPFEAAAAFVASTGKSKQIDAVVSWAPDIYTIPEKVKGTKILSSTQDANKTIADVWAVRADFARDNPKIVKGLVEGIFEGMELLKNKEHRKQACVWLASLYGMEVAEIEGMLQDAHSTNFAENVEFFLNANNPANFERTWKNINFVYKELGLISSPVPFDRVMDFTYIQQLKKEGKFSDQKDEYKTSFVPNSFARVQAESPILTQTIRINYYPNSIDPFEPAHDEMGKAIKGKYYDKSAAATLEKVARLAGQFEASTIAIIGHTDSSRKGQVPQEAVRNLSLNRAKAVKELLVNKYKFDPNKFVVEGKGWDEPFDPADPMNQAQNRRVDIKVYQPESN